jgi:hypothetical protein
MLRKSTVTSSCIHKISEPRLIAAWLSGYYNAKRNNRVIDLQALEENMSKVTNYCSDEKNFKVPVMPGAFFSNSCSGGH